MTQLKPANDLFSGALSAMENPFDNMKHHVSPIGGTKHDTGKPDISLVPYIAIECEARALGYGEQKYGRYNYTAGFESSRLTAAALRHLYAYIGGQNTDPESGLCHLGHARACLAMHLHCDQLGTLRDNRFRR